MICRYPGGAADGGAVERRKSARLDGGQRSGHLCPPWPRTGLISPGMPPFLKGGRGRLPAWPDAAGSKVAARGRGRPAIPAALHASDWGRFDSGPWRGRPDAMIAQARWSRRQGDNAWPGPRSWSGGRIIRAPDGRGAGRRHEKAAPGWARPDLALRAAYSSEAAAPTSSNSSAISNSAWASASAASSWIDLPEA